MSIDAALDLLCCPSCRQQLARAGGSVSCPSGHSFDLAKQGYLNLLGRAAPEHADTAEMLAARSRFLTAGFFEPVSDALSEALSDARPGGRRPRVLEVGAGTGHYASRLLDHTGGRGVALDISAPAARRAARAHPSLAAVVANVWTTLPLPDGAVDVVLAVFAPRNPTEFARILAPGGVVAVVTPEPDHLTELREPLSLMGIEPGKAGRLASAMPAELPPRTTRQIRYPVLLPETALVDLVAMGPNAFHRDQTAVLAGVRSLPVPLTVTVAVRVNVWRRR